MSSTAIFHITTPAAWERALASGQVEPDSLASEGFVHCSTAEQLEGTLARHFSDAADVVLLRLRRDALDQDLRWERSNHGGHYPHLYRPIQLDEVAEASSWRPGQPLPT